LDAIESAIRNAFERGDARDKNFREQVYRKAFAALDRALQANPELTVEAAINRRKVLQQKINEIEAEFQPAAAPEPAPMPEPPHLSERDPLAGAIPVRLEPGPAPEIEWPAEPDLGPVEPVLPDLGGLDVRAERRASEAAATSSLGAVEADRDPRRARGRRPYVYFFVAATLAAVIGIGLLFAWQTGLFLSREQRDTSVPNPPSADVEEYEPDAAEPPTLSSKPEPERDWITVFSPDDATAVSAPADTSAEAMEDESGAFLRIRSGSSGAAVLFDVGQGILDRLAGRKVTFNVIARTAEGGNTEMAVDCNFGELGDCGRRRYALGYDPADYLFELTLPDRQPGAGGTIAINSDFTGGGKAVDIYGIKVATSP